MIQDEDTVGPYTGPMGGTTCELSCRDPMIGVRVWSGKKHGVSEVSIITGYILYIVYIYIYVYIRYKFKYIGFEVQRTSFKVKGKMW